jgi:hypothetical protein
MLPRHQSVPAGLLFFALVSATVPLAAQSIITIPPQQCIWRAGDNPAWAVPSLDENGWLPYKQWQPQPDQVHMWIRCHANLSALQSASNPALQVSLYAAYALYLDGHEIGGAGSLRSGIFSMNVIRTYPLSSAQILNQPSTIALRITYRILGTPWPLPFSPLAISAGDAGLLSLQRNSVVLGQLATPFKNLVLFGINGVIGCMLLALFLYDRSHRELLILSVACIGIAGIFVTFFIEFAQTDAPIWAVILAGHASALATSFGQMWFPFAAARRRTPVFFWIIFALYALRFPPAIVSLLFFSAHSSLSFQDVLHFPWVGVSNYARLLCYTGAFVAFWPWKRITRRMIPIAITCMAWDVVMILYFLTPLNVFQGWVSARNEVQAIVTLCATAALLGLLFRDQQRTAQERAELAGEMHAASEIQRMLAPARIDTAPGLHIDVAFHPMREVGGDFYLCRVLPDGRQRVLLGDVSGKGAAAALAAAVILGAASARDSDSPAGILTHLNRVLRDNRLSGFATCLCADVAADGIVTLANAGHLAPYLAGSELVLESGLPLGLDGHTAYPESQFQLLLGAQLTLLTDGVVEARNASGELFGFERAAAISAQPVESIAHAAQAHGQEDDITVLSLTFAPVPKPICGPFARAVTMPA